MKLNKDFNIVVNGVIYNEKGQLLLARRSSKDDHEAGMWTTPGGTLEVNGENFQIIEETLQREIMEEVGIVIEDTIVLIANNTFVKTSGKNVLAIVFLCKHKSGTARPLDETDEVVWIDSVSDLDNYSFPPNVKEYFQKGAAALHEIR
jgi:8-oxo-dGTP diphosphatase